MNSDYSQFDPEVRAESPEDWPSPVDPPDSQGGGGSTGEANAELPGVTQQPPSQSDLPPGGDRPPTNS
ncbi:MAG TPA: hypothetical protein VFR51_07990 [Pyrinomonadaceae bacterium]|nr:hypothetical protein [Pyrinomonadaceae bacterium]